MDSGENIRLYNLTDYYIGLGLALFSSGFIGKFCSASSLSNFRLIQLLYEKRNISAHLLGVIISVIFYWNLIICVT